MTIAIATKFDDLFSAYDQIEVKFEGFQAPTGSMKNKVEKIFMDYIEKALTIDPYRTGMRFIMDYDDGWNKNFRVHVVIDFTTMKATATRMIEKNSGWFI